MNYAFYYKRVLKNGAECCFRIKIQIKLFKILLKYTVLTTFF